ncbi:endolytic transglycosylase MltG [Arthrobacter sp. FX8]|uniref:endolytic transglycosylase MltG n=1 Tax=Micrococcaceae TaxID=1268 RepID=UPI0006FA7E26|nr:MULTISPECIES: endolytic transglycosylase MltG [unclassified Arthrobacter]KRE73291.1 aminodeoxychorismate lyase [Arthrobacter sp. Soil761]WAJ34720.1 endolytic transglycosylase MltG [Arthrobacter sp. FX8]
MSPANIDDTFGRLDTGAGRPLTRKELRAREKSLNTGGQDAVPEQAYETGDVPPPPAAPPAAPSPAAAPTFAPLPGAGDVPAAPEAPPSIQDEEPAGPSHADPFDGDAAAPDAPAPLGHHDDVPHHGNVGGHDAVGHQDAVTLHDDVHHEVALHHDAAGHQDHVHHAADLHHPDLHDYQEVHDDHVHHAAGYHDDAHVDAPHHDVHHHDADHGLLPGSSAAQVVPRPSKKVRRRRRLLALFLTLAVFVAAVAVGAQFLKPLLGNGKPSDFPGPGSGEVRITVASGEGTRSVATELENQRVVANADTFMQAFHASGGTLSPGDYTFKTEMKNADAVNILAGKDKTKVIYFALSAGLRIGESLQAISEGSGISVQQLQALSNQPAQFGLPANAKNLEGYLAPGEYRFPLGTPAKDILQALVKSTTDELVSQGITDPAKQYQAVIVASIVQAEGGQADYGDVAGAIYNRLKPNDQTGGFLQVDSAVTYGLGTRSFNFTDEQRQDKSNPYNTYANPGLPPGPIGSPGKTAIDAAARPKANDYLYWVTINLDTKETKFAKTLAEHNAYVEQYNAWCQANAGRCT